ncbi:MAG TPA: bacterial transcriptional activator domain-containing protein, partial [Herpetosiphonaceae bacterium]
IEGAALVGVAAGPERAPSASGITILGAGALPVAAPPEPLHIQTLGQARVWRGPVEITAWGRKSAVLLMGVLLTSRGEWLQREQICDLLWPEADPATAEAQFKVALNALSNALEPQRPPRSLGRPLERRGSAYRINPRAEGLRLDAARFEELLDRAADAGGAARAELLRRALALYQGDYLADCLYSDWARETRERLRGRFLAGACALAGLALDMGRLAEAERWAEAALARDACCEEAYQLLLRVHAAEGNRAQVCRVYERCAAALWCELGLEPLPQTTELYRAATLNP